MKFEDSAKVDVHVDGTVKIKAGAGEYLSFHFVAKSRTDGGRGVLSFINEDGVLLEEIMPTPPPHEKLVIKWYPPAALRGTTKWCDVQAACSLPAIEFDVVVQHHTTGVVETLLKFTCWSDEVSDLGNLFVRGFNLRVI